MIGKKTAIQLLLLCGAMGLSSCAGKPPAATVSQVSQAELAVQQASQSKAPDYASVELYTAREQLAGAQDALHKKQYTEARRWAERALVNAQLAEAKADAEQTRRAAAELRQSIEALRREVESPAATSR
jgi:chromosome segregation ATPase